MTQTYRFRSYINRNGADAFQFAVRAIGEFRASAETAASTVDVTIAPVDDAPQSTEFQVHVGYYSYRGSESFWVDPLVGRCRLALSKPVLKAPLVSALRIKRKYDELLSSFAFKFNLRHYTLDPNATQYTYSTVALNATSVDGEVYLLANLSHDPR